MSDPTYGVLYLNSGKKLVERLYVSLGSLREVYKGSVTVLLSNEPPEVQPTLEKNGFNVRRLEATPGHVNALLCKTMLNQFTPYDYTVFIDADTLVLKPFQELFDWAEEHTFVATQFANWSANRSPIGKRVRSWHLNGVTSKEEYEAARAYTGGREGGINVGVLAFQRDATIFQDWYDLAVRGKAQFIPDEISCQYLLPKHRHYLAPTEFNSSCRFSPCTEGTRIIHYHGHKQRSIIKTYPRGDPNVGLASMWIAERERLGKLGWCGLKPEVKA